MLNINSSIQNCINFSYNDYNENISLLSNGKGVFIFNYLNYDKEPCIFKILNNEKNDGYIVEFTQKNIIVKELESNLYLEDKNNNKGLISLNGAYYWFSIDSKNQCLYAGIGEPRIETIVYEYNYNYIKTTPNLLETNKNFMESLTTITIINSNIIPLKLFREPISNYISLYVKDIDELTMDDIANNNYLPSLYLSPISQLLYNSISGKKFVLDDSDFPDFTKAIEHSITTPGLWCYEKLIQQSSEFNKDKYNIHETYLRIKIGNNNDNYSDIHYEMNIWPIGHYSPIYCDSYSDAIIRVLHGNINILLYPFFNNNRQSISPFTSANFTKDNITWVSPTLNKIHQFKNLDTNKDICITIKSYICSFDNFTNYNKDIIQQYENDTIDFTSFKELMKIEWENKKQNFLEIIFSKKFWINSFNLLNDILLPNI